MYLQHKYFCRLCLELQHLLNYDKVQGKRDLASCFIGFSFLLIFQ